MPSLLSKVIRSQGQDERYYPSRIGYSQVQGTKAGTFTRIVVLDIGDMLWFLSQKI